MVFDRIVWMLSIEDANFDGFIDEERRELRQVTDLVKDTLEQLVRESLLEEIFRKSPSVGIFVIDPHGMVTDANFHALRVAGREVDEVEERPFAELFGDQGDHDLLIATPEIRGLKCALRRPDGALRYVLMSSTPLANSFGLRVVYAEELSELELQSDLQTVQGALARAAQQSVPPLKKVLQLVDEVDKQLSAETIDRWRKEAQRHLATIKLTYDRIAHFMPKEEERYERRRMDLREPLEMAKAALNLTSPTETWIETSDSGVLLPVHGDADELRHVFLSLLDYLKRRKPDSEKVLVQLDRNVSGSLAMARFFASANIGPPGPKPDDLLEAAFQAGRSIVALGEPGMKRIIEVSHGGRYNSSQAGGKRTFVIEVPLEGCHRRKRGGLAT